MCDLFHRFEIPSKGIYHELAARTLPCCQLGRRFKASGAMEWLTFDEGTFQGSWSSARLVRITRPNAMSIYATSEHYACDNARQRRPRDSEHNLRVGTAGSRSIVFPILDVASAR